MPSNEYPLPGYAVSIWHRGNDLAVQLPDGRTLSLPLERLQVDRTRADQRGWQELMQLLAARRDFHQRRERPQLGSQASPLATELELALKGHPVRKYSATGRLQPQVPDLWQDDSKEQSDGQC